MERKVINTHIERLYDKYDKEKFLNILDIWINETLVDPPIKSISLELSDEIKLILNKQNEITKRLINISGIPKKYAGSNATEFKQKEK